MLQNMHPNMPENKGVEHLVALERYLGLSSP
jgi:hypothetical protein